MTLQTLFFKLQFLVALVGSCILSHLTLVDGSEEERRTWVQQKSVYSSKGFSGHVWVTSEFFFGISIHIVV